MHAIKQLNHAPWLFRAASFLIEHRIRGGDRLVDWASRLGVMNCRVRYPLSSRVSLDVPLYRPDNQWSRNEVVGYESKLIGLVSRLANPLPGPVRLIDCGADIGTVSALLTSRCPALTELWALEPNPVAFEVLQGNIKRLPLRGHACRVAVCDFTGRGRLQRSTTDPSDHAMFLAPAADGDIEVIRIDDLNVPTDGSLVIKIDVEGFEINVLRGAVATLGRVSNWIVVFEAHREVCTRTGIDPRECLRLLNGIRPIAALIGERPDLRLDFERPYFEQVTEPKITNVVCRSL